MEKEQKVQVVFEFDRSEYDTFLFLSKIKKDEESESFWKEMVKEPITAKTEDFEDGEQMMKLAVISAAIFSVKDKVEKLQDSDHE